MRRKNRFSKNEQKSLHHATADGSGDRIVLPARRVPLRCGERSSRNAIEKRISPAAIV
jgi:hypothetical protein